MWTFAWSAVERLDVPGACITSDKMPRSEIHKTQSCQKGDFKDMACRATWKGSIVRQMSSNYQPEPPHKIMPRVDLTVPIIEASRRQNDSLGPTLGMTSPKPCLEETIHLNDDSPNFSLVLLQLNTTSNTSMLHIRYRGNDHKRPYWLAAQ